jgi:hypothetical protein
MRPFMAIALFSVVTACAADDTTADDNNPDTVDNTSGKEDASYPVGIFNSTTAKSHDGTVKELTLNSDKTFSRTNEVAACPQLDSGCAVTTGKYTFSHSGSTRYVRLLTTDGTLMERYAYKLSGETMQLRASGDTAWDKLTNPENTKLKLQDQCDDANGNPMGICPDNLGCVPDLDDNIDECLPEI